MPGTPTDYTSTYTAAQIDKVVGEILPVDIASGTDVDTLITPGIYLSYANTTSQTLVNIPSEAANYSFRLEVKSLRNDDRLLEQRLISASNPLRVFYRRYSSSTWGEWAEDTGYENSLAPWRVIKKNGEYYYKIATITSNRGYPLHIGGCCGTIANHFDLDVFFSRDSCVVYGTILHGTGYGNASNLVALFFDSGTLYIKSATYTQAVIMAYSTDTFLQEFGEVASLPATATFVPLSTPNVTVYSGSSAPSSSLGNDGDIYIQTS